MIMSLKQKEIKFRPRIKLSHNIYINLYFWISVWGVRIVVVVRKKIKQLIDKGYFKLMNFFKITLNNFSKENFKK